MWLYLATLREGLNGNPFWRGGFARLFKKIAVKARP